PTPSLMAFPYRLRPVPTKIVADRVPSTPCACAAATEAMTINIVAASRRFNVKDTPWARTAVVSGHPLVLAFEGFPPSYGFDRREYSCLRGRVHDARCPQVSVAPSFEH